jgi:hypothetical protein
MAQRRVSLIASGALGSAASRTQEGHGGGWLVVEGTV